MPSKARKCPPQKVNRLKQGDLATLAKAIGHPIRIQIIRLLKSKKNCICGELVDGLPIAQSTVSQHLKVLKSAGFIRGTISGPSTCYCLEPKTFNLLKKMIHNL